MQFLSGHKMQLGDFQHGRGACQRWTMGLKFVPSRLPQFFLPKNPPLDQKLKVDLFKGCLSADTFQGFITFPWEVFISTKFRGGGRLFQLLWKGQQENICFCWRSLFATFVWNLMHLPLWFEHICHFSLNIFSY